MRINVVGVRGDTDAALVDLHETATEIIIFKNVDAAHFGSVPSVTTHGVEHAVGVDKVNHLIGKQYAVTHDPVIKRTITHPLDYFTDKVPVEQRFTTPKRELHGRVPALYPVGRHPFQVVPHIPVYCLF